MTVSATASKSSFELAGSTPIASGVDWGPSMMESSTPPTVTDWGESQLALVNVRDVGVVLTSPGSPGVRVTRTSLPGLAVSTTCRSSVEPLSLTSVSASEPWGVEVTTEIPATSLSIVVTPTVSGASVPNAGCETTGSTVMVTELATSPSIRSSSTPVTVMVCGVAQSAGVNVSEVGPADASVGSDRSISKTTGESGSTSRTTVN